MSARFDKIPSLPVENSKEKPKCCGRKDGHIERWTDNVKTVYPLQTVCGGVTRLYVKPQLILPF